MTYKTIAPLTRRAIVFLGVFLVLSGLVGIKVISSGIVDRDYFGWYGTLGKAILFAAVAFYLLTRSKLKAFADKQPAPDISWKYWNAAFAAMTIGWLSLDELGWYGHQWIWIVVAQLSIITGIALLALACFSAKGLKLFCRQFKKELGKAALAGAGFTVLLWAVYAFWAVLAAAVLHSVAWLLHVAGLSASVVPPRTLLLDKFGVTVAQYCSGVESLALFGGLYAVIGFLDWHRLNKRRFFGLLPAALALLFGLNILRVFVLIVAGYYINPQIAFSLFHTYAGMIFFIVYALIFWKVCYRWMLRKD